MDPFRFLQFTSKLNEELNAYHYDRLEDAKLLPNFCYTIPY